MRKSVYLLPNNLILKNVSFVARKKVEKSLMSSVEEKLLGIQQQQQSQKNPIIFGNHSVLCTLFLCLSPFHSVEHYQKQKKKLFRILSRLC